MAGLDERPELLHDGCGFVTDPRETGELQAKLPVPAPKPGQTGYAKPERKESDSDLKETFMRDRAAGPFLFGVLLQNEEAFFMQAALRLRL